MQRENIRENCHFGSFERWTPCIALREEVGKQNAQLLLTEFGKILKELDELQKEISSLQAAMKRNRLFTDIPKRVRLENRMASGDRINKTSRDKCQVNLSAD